MIRLSTARAGACAALIALPLLAAGPASAGPLSATEILQQFGVVVFGSMSSTSNMEGRAYVGGSLSGGEFNSRTTAPASAYDELIVGGSLSGNVKVQNGGDATVGGSGSGVLEMNAGSTGTRTAKFGGTYAGTFNQGTKLENQAVSIPDFQTTLTEASAALAGLDGDAPGVSGNRATFSLSPDSEGLTVYEIADGAGFFGSIGEIDFSLNGAETVVVNVGGSSLSLADNFLGGPFSLASHIIWNFYEATSLSIGTQWFGTVLAPYAAVTNTSAIEGSLVAASFQQRAQVHLQPITGLPDPSEEPTVEVPEPGTLALLLMGVLGVLWMAAGRGRQAGRAAA